MNVMISVPLWQLIIVLCVGMAVGCLVLVSAILILSHAANKESNPKSDSKQAVVKSIPQPKPLSKKEADDLKRLLARQAGERIADSADVTVVNLQPQQLSVTTPVRMAAKTRSNGVANVVDAASSVTTNHVPVTGFTCQFCQSQDIYTTDKPTQTMRNGKVLNVYQCGSCNRKLTRWT